MPGDFDSFGLPAAIERALPDGPSVGFADEGPDRDLEALVDAEEARLQRRARRGFGRRREPVRPRVQPVSEAEIARFRAKRSAPQQCAMTIEGAVRILRSRNHIVTGIDQPELVVDGQRMAPDAVIAMAESINTRRLARA